jgi:hypothetical protein
MERPLWNEVDQVVQNPCRGLEHYSQIMTHSLRPLVICIAKGKGNTAVRTIATRYPDCDPNVLGRLYSS